MERSDQGRGGREQHGAQFENLGPQRSILSDWTQRIAKGQFPKNAPPRPTGVERNLVITEWDWSGRASYAHDEAASDKRDYRVNANGPIYGPNQFGDAEFADVFQWVDPVMNSAGKVKIPSTAPMSAPQKTAYLPNEPIWAAQVEPRSAAIDHKGRVWAATRIRPTEKQPDYCKAGSTNDFAEYYPLNVGNKQVSMFDPKTKQFTQIDTCFSTDHNEMREDDKVFFGFNSGVGWIDMRVLDKQPSGKPPDSQAVQGWCPGVLDINGDGKITKGWTEPEQAIDPTKDHRIQFPCYQPGVSPPDGSVWCGSGNEVTKTIVRMEIGSNPPETCHAETYEVPPNQDVSGARGVEVDSAGVVWVNMTTTDHFASFDRRKCKGSLKGPNATGQQCPEGWSFYPIPDPAKFEGVPSRGADNMYLTHVDRFDVLGLNNGKDVPTTEMGNSGALLLFLPQTGKFVRLTVPYPLGMLARSNHGRIDDEKAGWKGRGLWTSFTSWTPWHTEGGMGTKPKVVKLQMRPNPLAK